MDEQLQSLEDHITTLARVRHEEELWGDNTRKLWEKVEQTLEYQAWKESSDMHHHKKGLVGYLENLIRQTVLNLQGQQLGPIYPVKIKVFTVPKYDLLKAINWCKDAMPTALTLDVKKFEKVASAGVLDFVELVKELRVQIASNLDDYQPKNQDEINRSNIVLDVAEKALEEKGE